MSTTAKQ